MAAARITTLLLDVGGVLLTNGWGRSSRRAAAERFQLELDELETRHDLNFGTFELGKLSLADYLDRVVFHVPRDFSHQEFVDFMFSRSQALPGAADWFLALKRRHGLRVIALSNEGRELNRHRIAAFGLEAMFDAFLSSSAVHLRKPDLDFYRLALDVAVSPPEEIAYVDDQAMFADVARGLGINAVHHVDLESTAAALADFGLATA